MIGAKDPLRLHPVLSPNKEMSKLMADRIDLRTQCRLFHLLYLACRHRILDRRSLFCGHRSETPFRSVWEFLYCFGKRLLRGVRIDLHSLTVAFPIGDFHPVCFFVWGLEFWGDDIFLVGMSADFAEHSLDIVGGCKLFFWLRPFAISYPPCCISAASH